MTCGLVMTMDGMLSSTIRNRKGHESTKRRCARGVKTSLQHLEDTVAPWGMAGENGDHTGAIKEEQFTGLV